MGFLKFKMNPKVNPFEEKKNGFPINLPAERIFIPKEGKNKIRILPPHENETLLETDRDGNPTYYGVKFFFHSRIGIENNIFPCRYKMLGEYCPVCEEYAKLRKLQYPYEVIKDLRPNKKILLWVLDLNDGSNPNIVKLFVCPSTLAQAIFEKQTFYSIEKEQEIFIDVIDLDEGRIVEFERVGQGIKTSYEQVMITKKYPIVQIDPIASQIKPFKDIINWYSETEIDKIFSSHILPTNDGVIEIGKETKNDTPTINEPDNKSDDDILDKLNNL